MQLVTLTSIVLFYINEGCKKKRKKERKENETVLQVKLQAYKPDLVLGPSN